MGEIISRFEKKGFKLTGLKLFECSKELVEVCSRCNTCLCVCMSCVECSGFSYCWDYYGVQVRKKKKREIEGSQ